MQVLVAEDDHNVRRFFSKPSERGAMARSRPSRVITRWIVRSTRGRAAIILDVMLPGRDGFHVVCELRPRRVFTPAPAAAIDGCGLRATTSCGSRRVSPA
jgi:DNA-binding response OmpR family regulator